MHNSTEAEIKRVVLNILDHSKPSTCERCKHYDECFSGTFKEAIHECCNHYGNYSGAEWDKEIELDKLNFIFAMDANGETILKKNDKLRHD